MGTSLGWRKKVNCVPVWDEGNACQEAHSSAVSCRGQACINGHQIGLDESIASLEEANAG